MSVKTNEASTVQGETSETTREDIPLKSGSKANTWYKCSDDYIGGLKFVNIAFGTLTVVITLALFIQIHYGDYQVVPHGSVSTDSLECSQIGTTILKRNGNAVDAAIASAFCLAVVAPHLTGLDAGGQLLTYSHKTRLPPTLVDFSGYNESPKELPRLVLGLAYFHQQYGTLPWKELVEPSVNLAQNGYLVSKMLVQAINKAHAEDLYGRLEPGQLLSHEALSKTLETIANIQEKELYSFIDHEYFRGKVSQTVKTTFRNYDIFVPDTNTSIGPLLADSLKEIDSFNFTLIDTFLPDYSYKIAEGTQQFYNDRNVSANFHDGTNTNIAVIDKDENYVALVLGMYEFFGSEEMTDHGYVLDVKNKTKPCSRLPLIITDSRYICKRRIVTGAANLATAIQLITALAVGQQNGTQIVEAPRFYALSNGTVAIEGFHTPAFSEDALKYLQTLASNVILMPEPYPASNVVEKFGDELSSHADSRGGGIASRF